MNPLYEYEQWKKESYPATVDSWWVHEKSKKRMALQVKAKPARTHYPDTGFNTSSYRNYLDFMRVNDEDIMCVFVDEHAGMVYRQWLTILEIERFIYWDGHNLRYPQSQWTNTKKCITYYPVEAMEIWFTLSENEIAQLKSLSVRNKKYVSNPKVIARIGAALKTPQLELFVAE